LIDGAGQKIGNEFTLHAANEQRIFSQFSQAACFGTYLFRREIFTALPRRSAFPFSSDYDFIARAVERWPLEAMPEVLFSYRIHGAQTTTVRRREQIVAECAIRLLAARRRAGRAEDFGSIELWKSEVERSTKTVAEVYRACLRQCEREGWPVLQSYHARKLLSVSRAPADVGCASAHAMHAWRTAEGASSIVASLFFRGPLKTYGLKPWPQFG
jgi:hypothetical protein